MWTQYRRWKHALIFPLAALAWLLMNGEPEFSLRWSVGLGLAVTLGVAYLAEEMVWIAKRQGRPCGHCGRKIPLESFRVLTTCPHCGQPLD
jgi:hypothetical protein